MDGIRDLLEKARTGDLVTGHFRGLLHIAIGRTVSRPDSTVVSTGLTWRELAALLKELRFDRELVREYGADPDSLAPRDRERFWYSAIAQAHVDSPEASGDADALIPALRSAGFVVSPASGRATPRKAKPLEPKAKPKAEKPAKKKRK